MYRYGRPSLPALQVVTDDPRLKLSRSVGVKVLGDPCSRLLANLLVRTMSELRSYNHNGSMRDCQSPDMCRQLLPLETLKPTRIALADLMQPLVMQDIALFPWLQYFVSPKKSTPPPLFMSSLYVILWQHSIDYALTRQAGRSADSRCPHIQQRFGQKSFDLHLPVTRCSCQQLYVWDTSTMCSPVKYDHTSSMYFHPLLAFVPPAQSDPGTSSAL